MQNEFNVGQVVILKSGGPKMTISQINDRIIDGDCKCMWFNKEGNRMEAPFYYLTIEDASDKLS